MVLKRKQRALPPSMSFFMEVSLCSCLCGSYRHLVWDFQTHWTFFYVWTSFAADRRQFRTSACAEAVLSYTVYPLRRPSIGLDDSILHSADVYKWNRSGAWASNIETIVIRAMKGHKACSYGQTCPLAVCDVEVLLELRSPRLRTRASRVVFRMHWVNSSSMSLLRKSMQKRAA